MLQPQEIEVWYLIPALRKMLVEELHKRNLKSTEIANILHLTKASVSHYLSNKRGAVRINNFDDEIKKSADALITGSCPTKEIQRLIIKAIKKGILCDLHRRVEKVNDNCHICMNMYKDIEV